MSARSSLPDDQSQLRPFAYRVSDAGKMLSVRRTTIFGMIRTGTLEARKIGAATVITHESLKRVFRAAELADATKRVPTQAAATSCTAPPYRSASPSRSASTP